MEQPKCSNQELWTKQDPDQLEHIKKGPDAVFFHAATWLQCFTCAFLPGLIGGDSVVFSGNDRDPHYFCQLCQRKPVCVDFAS